MNPEQAEQLRAPFPPEQIGKLPKAGISLDFVGHAAVTDRLLKVDPLWTWEPFAIDEHGAPLVGRNAKNESVLWIRLTVCGHTRIGVGIVSAGSFDLEKQLIGDAIRNAAMRFGVALDLWSKEDLSAPPSPAPVDTIKELTERMNALPHDLRVQCKRMFSDLFGAPADLKESDVPAAMDHVADWESKAREQTPPTPASAPSPTEPQSVGQELGSGAPVREDGGGSLSVETPDPTPVAVESSPLPDAPVNEGTAAAPAVPSPKERADRLAEKAKRPAPADHTVSAHEAKQ